MNHWRKVHSVKKIKEALGLNDYGIYKEFEKLGVEVEKRGRQKRAATAKKKEPAAAMAAAPQLSFEIETADLETVVQSQQPQILPAAHNGISLYLNDELTPEEAINKLMKYAAFLEGEANKVKIRLEICEVKEGE